MVEKFFESWIIKDCIEIQVKEKKVVVLCCRPQQKRRKIRTFHAVVVHRRWRNVQKSVTQSCFYFKPIAFSPFSLPSPSSILVSSLISFQEVTVLLVISNKNLPRDKSNESSGEEIACHRTSCSYRVRYSLLWETKEAVNSLLLLDITNLFTGCPTFLAEKASRTKLINSVPRNLGLFGHRVVFSWR